MKSRRDLWHQLLLDMEEFCAVGSTSRDFKTVSDRVDQEGDAFFFITLPSFAKDLERSLRLGYIPRDAFIGWKRRPRNAYCWVKPGDFIPGNSSPANGDFTSVRLVKMRDVKQGSPRFLGGFLDLIFSDVIVTDKEELIPILPVDGGFHSSDDKWNESLAFAFPICVNIHAAGSVEDAQVAKAIYAVRQLCLAFSKEKELCAPSKVKEAVQSFVETDNQIADTFQGPRADRLFEGGLLNEAKKVMHLVFGNVLHAVSREIYDGTLLPKHGPGATADRNNGNQKWVFREWTDRLETLFPYGDFGLPNQRFNSADTGIRWLSPADERPVKLTAVAKTYSKPRLIAIEPTCMQYVQQAISQSLVHRLERHPASRSFVGFEHQWPNQAMAQCGSDDGSVATLDLSEASDRVANWLVEDLFAPYTWFLEGVQACRSTRVQLPSGEVHQLLKFASMGSALTFPIEAIVFTTVALLGVCKHRGLSLKRGTFRSLRDVVRVYGDDIIVPTDCAETVIDLLETFGFLVNRDKSFWTGKFRESCGKEYWNGHDVSIVRFRKVLPTSRHDVDSIVSTSATRNLFQKDGCVRTVEALDELLTNVLGVYPYVAETSVVLGRTHESGLYQIDSWHPTLHAPRVKGWKIVTKLPRNGIDGVPALLKCLLETIGEPSADPEHLTRSGRPRAVRIKLGKASPF